MSPPDPRMSGRMDAHFARGHETATQCVASAGFSSRDGPADDLRFVVRSDLRGRPERGRFYTDSSSTPPASYRRDCVTVGLDTPTSRQIADPDNVPRHVEQRTMSRPFRPARTVLAVWSVCSPIAPSALRSPRRNRILRTGSPIPGRCTGLSHVFVMQKRFCYTPQELPRF